jgi:hypothetical protein
MPGRESETFAVYQDDFEQLRRRHPAVSGVLVRFLVNEIRMLNERLLERCTCRWSGGSCGGSRSSRRFIRPRTDPRF